MKDFKLKAIFEIEKEKPISSSGIFRKNTIAKYKINEKECNEIFRRITNYQIKKYGANLTGSFITHERW